MALTHCPDCQNQVSTEAASCPHCGYPLSKPTADPPPSPRTSPSEIKRQLKPSDANKRVCLDCGHIGEPITKEKEGAPSCLLWLFLIFISCGIGLILFIVNEMHKSSGRKTVCASCNSERQVRLDSAKGLELLSTSPIWSEMVEERSQQSEVRKQLEVERAEENQRRRVAEQRKAEAKRKDRAELVELLRRHPIWVIVVIVLLVSLGLLAADVALNPEVYFG